MVTEEIKPTPENHRISRQHFIAATLTALATIGGTKAINLLKNLTSKDELYYLPPELSNRKKIDTSLADELNFDESGGRDRVSAILVNWAVAAMNLPPDQSGIETARLMDWMEYQGNINKGATECIAELPRLMILANPELLEKHQGSFQSYVEKEYLPKIISLADTLGLPPILVLQFLQRNTNTASNASRFNKDVKEYQKQVLLGATQSQLSKMGYGPEIAEIIQVAGALTPNGNEEAPGIYNMIRVSTPSVLAMDIETETIAQGIFWLHQHNPSLYRQLEADNLELALSALELTKHRQGIEVHKQKISLQIEKYIRDIENIGLKDTPWNEIIFNKDHPFWEKIGLTGSASKNTVAKLYNLCNYTFAWMRASEQTQSTGDTLSKIDHGFQQALQDYLLPAQQGNWQHTLRQIFIQQVGNPAFEDWLKGIESPGLSSADIRASHQTLEWIINDHRAMLAKTTSELVKTELNPTFETPLTLATAAHLDSLSDNQIYPNLSRYRQNHYCRTFLFQVNRDEATLEGVMVDTSANPKMRLARTDTPLYSADFMMHHLDKILGHIEQKVATTLNTSSVNPQDIFLILSQLLVGSSSEHLDNLLGRQNASAWCQEQFSALDPRQPSKNLNLNEYLELIRGQYNWNSLINIAATEYLYLFDK